MTWIPIVAGVASVLAMALLGLGVRGRRVGDHPFCRRCGFDLFGKSDASKTCPECGSGLNLPGAIVIGMREPRRRVLAIGSTLLVPSLVIVILAVWIAASGTNVQPYKPVWWLAHEARGSDVPTRDAALRELLMRMNGGKLSDARVRSLLEDALTMQARLDVPWSTGWGDIVETAGASGKVTDAQWSRYARQTVAEAWTLAPLPRIRADGPLSYTIKSNGARVGRGQALFLLMNDPDVLIDGTPWSKSRARAVMYGGLFAGGAGSFGSSARATVEPRRPLAPGQHHGELAFSVIIVPARSLPRDVFAPPATRTADGLRDWSRKRQEALTKIPTSVHDGSVAALVQIDLKLPFDVEVVPADQSPFERVTDESLRPDVENVVHVRDARVMGSMITVQIDCKSPPVPLAFSAFARDGDREWLLGEVAVAADPRLWRPLSQLRAMMNGGETLRGETIDIVLRPDEKVAANLPGIDKYWGKEVVIKDVKVEDPFRAARQFREQVQQPMIDAARAAASSQPATLPFTADELAAARAKGGLILRIDTFKVTALAAVGTPPTTQTGAPSHTEAIIVYPNLPFLHRGSDGTSATRISGTVAPLAGDTDAYDVRLEIATDHSNGTSRTKLDHIRLPLGARLNPGMSNDTAEVITLLPAK